MMFKPTGGSALFVAVLLSSTAPGLAGQIETPALQIVPTLTNTVSLSWRGFGWGHIQECSNLDVGAWVAVTNAPTLGEDNNYELVLPLQPGNRFYRFAFDCLAQFVTGNSTFTARVDCDSAELQNLRWNWWGGDSDTNWPVIFKDFGTADIRLQVLTVSPASAVTAINIGFDGADSGWTNQLTSWPPQAVSAVQFVAPLTNLQYWASSYTPITALDFTGFTALQSIDCYRCDNLEQVVVSNLPALRRVCFESCRLPELDVSGAVNLEELRAADNLYQKVGVTGGVGPKIWHWCTRDNPFTQQFLNFMTNYYSIQDFYAWNDNQEGLLKLVTTNLMDVAAYSNRYTHADFSGQTNLWRCQIFNNNLTNLVLTDCVGLKELDASYNQLPAAVLDEILRQLDANAPALLYADLSGNAEPPTTVGFEHYTNLLNRGVTIFVDGP